MKIRVLITRLFLKRRFATYDIDGLIQTFLYPIFHRIRWKGIQRNVRWKATSICSIKWKNWKYSEIFVMKDMGEKYLTARGVDSWMGISIEEAKRRAKYPTGKGRGMPSTSIEMLMTKQMAMCRGLWSSSHTTRLLLCWMCPNRDDDCGFIWKNNVPSDFEKSMSWKKRYKMKWPPICGLLNMVFHYLRQIHQHLVWW